MRLASIITLLLLWYSSAPAQTLKYTPIPPAAAEVIAALPNAQHLDSIRQNYVAAPLQVRDGVEVILVEGRGIGPCGAANCQAYILEQQGNTYRLLLNARVIQQTHVLNSVTNGYHDIQTDMHGSATSSALRIYRYDGHEYRLTDCFTKDYYYEGVDAKGEDRIRSRSSSGAHQQDGPATNSIR